MTESAYVKDSEKFLSVIEKVKQKGFIIKMDDIGSGYSSLNTPSELHIDVMKLDLKFLRQTEDNRCGGLTFELPKKWVKISPPRALSDAQKRVLDEMNQRNRERRQSA